MAQTCTWQGDAGGGNYNWGTANNWHGSVSDHTVPIAGDAVVFSNAVNCTIAATAACASIDCTGYTGALTQNANITTTGNVTLVAGMTFTYTSGTWTCSGAAQTLTSGGKEFGALTFSASTIVVTLGDNVTVNGTFTGSAGSSNYLSIDGNTLICKGDIYVNAYCKNGTTLVSIAGGGNQAVDFRCAGGASFGNNVDVNSTGGIVTFANVTHYLARSFTYTRGTVAFGTSTIRFDISGSGAGSVGTRNIGGFSFYNLIIYGRAETNTIDADITVNNTLTLGSSLTCAANGNSIIALGTVSMGDGTYKGLTGTTTLKISGSGAQAVDFRTLSTSPVAIPVQFLNTGTATLANVAHYVSGNLTFNCGAGGSVVMVNTLYYKTGTLTYTAGTVDCSTNTHTLNIAGSCTLATTGIEWYNVTVASASTVTLSSNLDIANTFLITGAGIVNGAFNINASGSVTVNAALSGTATLVMDGTGTWSASANSSGVRSNLTINTAGTITFGSLVVYGSSGAANGTFTYTTGTVDTSTNSSQLYLGDSDCTLNLNGMSLYDCKLGASGTLTLSSNLDIDNDFLSDNGGYIINGNQITIGGDYIFGGTGMTGTTTFKMNGTGTLSGTFQNAITIDTAGTITLGNITYRSTVLGDGTGVFTYTAGTVNVTAGTTLTLSYGCTIDTGSSVLWQNVTTTGSNGATTLSDDLYIDGTLTVTVGRIFNGNTIYASGSVTVNAALSGTATLVMDGTGTWSAGSSSGTIANNLTFNSAGTITLGANVYYKTGTLTWTAGTIDVATNSATLNLPNTCTLITNGMSWYNVTTVTAGTCTLGSALDVNNTLTIGASTTLNCNGKQLNVAGNFTRTGTFTHGNNLTVFDGTTTINDTTTFYNLTISPGATVHVTSTKVITMNAFNAIGTGGSPIVLDAVTASSAAHWDATSVGTVSYVTATDIDSATGSAIVDTNGTLLRTVNWSVPGGAAASGSLMFGMEF